MENNECRKQAAHLAATFIEQGMNTSTLREDLLKAGRTPKEVELILHNLTAILKVFQHTANFHQLVEGLPPVVYEVDAERGLVCAHLDVPTPGLLLFKQKDDMIPALRLFLTLLKEGLKPQSTSKTPSLSLVKSIDEDEDIIVSCVEIPDLYLSFDDEEELGCWFQEVINFIVNDTQASEQNTHPSREEPAQEVEVILRNAILPPSPMLRKTHD